MAETILPLTWPSKGIVEGWAFSDQPQESAREMQNCRYQDCVTGRLRGAQRAGMSKYLTSALKTPGTKAVGLVSFFVDNRQVTYSTLSSETTTWSEILPSKGSSANVKTDRQGNSYALDGNSSVVKYSADGEKLWQLAIPVKDTNHVVRALWVDDLDHVYVGVSAGGVQSTAAIWCYEQLPDNKTEQLWEIQTKAYTEDMRTAHGKLYTCQNRTDRKKSLVRIYEFIETANPELTQEWRVPHPVNSIAVKADASVIVACPASTEDTTLYWRDRDPVYPESSPDSVDWTLDRLEDSEKRLWSHLKGDTIDQSDVATDIADGVGILRWRDTSKGLRHHYATIGDGQTILDEPPILAMDAYLEHKGVRFNIGNENGPYQALRSQPNASISTSFADQQRTLLPAYGSHTNGAATNSGWAMFIVCRPSQSAPDATATPRWLIGQDRDNASSGSDFHQVFINASAANGNSLPPTASAGRVFWYTGETALADGSSATVGQIREGRFDIRQDNGSNPDSTTTNKGQICIITMVCDGAISNTSTNAQKSFFRINGSPIDSFQSRAQATLHASFIGLYRDTISNNNPNPSNTVKNLLGDILEIVVLDRRSRTTSTDAIVTCDDLQYDSLATSQTINEVTTIEGMLAHDYGAQINLPYGTAAANNYPHPFGITGTGQDRLSGPPTINSSNAVVVSTAQALANKAFACVVKYDSKGKIVWCANEMELISGDRSGGYGTAVAVDSDGNILSFGEHAIGSGSHDFAVLRKIIDQGTDFSIQVADGAWSITSPDDSIFSARARIDVDEFKNVYVPWAIDFGTDFVFRVWDTNGTALHTATFGNGGCIAVAVDRRIPDYRSDISPKRVEHVIAVGSPGTVTDSAAFKVRLVTSTQASGAVRSLYSMGVSGGDIVRFTTSGVTTPTGGSGALDSSAKYVQATSLYKRAYWTDGRQLKQYEPITNAVTEYKCLSAGAIPSRCALIESWRGRIVLARSADEPHNWFMSKKDEPTNWDYFPPVPSEVDAVAGNNSAAGLCPDIINSIVPYSEDWLLFGGDHSIWALVGDPAAGGRLELISDITGMAFGRPWCKDPNGVLYFVGSRGGLFRWVPGAKPERISLGRIERQLQDINFSEYHVKLAWNYQDEGVHILQCPFGAGATQVAHWFYEARADGFAKDIFGTTAYTNVQPTDVLVLDGDEFDDRVLVFGCEDGFIRKWDAAAKSDDTRTDGTTKIPIDAFVTWFPIQSGEQLTGMETQFHGLTVVLGDRDDGVRYELFSSDEPDSLGISRVSGFFGPGRNPPSWEKVVGSYCGLRLRNAAAEERFSFERAYLYAAQAGMSRPRARN